MFNCNSIYYTSSHFMVTCLKYAIYRSGITSNLKVEHSVEQAPISYNGLLALPWSVQYCHISLANSSQEEGAIQTGCLSYCTKSGVNKRHTQYNSFHIISLYLLYYFLVLWNKILPSIKRNLLYILSVCLSFQLI